MKRESSNCHNNYSFFVNFGVKIAKYDFEVVAEGSAHKYARGAQ